MIRRLSWDSEFFGIGVGTCGDLPDSPEDLEDLIRDLHRSDMDLVYVNLPLQRMDLISGLLKKADGARLVDVRGTFQLDLNLQGPIYDRGAAGETAIEKAVEGDLGNIADIAASCFRGLTRFYRDPGISEDRCDLLYRTWAERDIRDTGRVNVACRDGGRIAGFCTAGIGDRGDARLGLIGVSSTARGSGLGGGMLHRIADLLRKRGCGRLGAVTQMGNPAAVRMYEKAGFMLLETEAVIHLWRSAREAGHG